VGMHSKGTQTA
nr:Chain B, Nek9 Protein [Homo sapiens]3ZKE_D Chain D, Nek9 Protein [Homo sapiens]3ZKE_F Chain F, Nek9 Protein [Homo sapiens]3ZKE_H Chain H, Nek9 Protein [Homo sapiens]3ZKE_J Chain J, Nek9 Protein [Homo sapiens]3ZKE_L Chain L, Nek9 Protein [Homo sapiens]